jgi:DNA helicase-2/ATP-dependent DNA helicase PcrA
MKNDGALLEPSQFIEEIRQPMKLDIQNINLSDEDKFHFSSLRFGVVQKPVLQQAEKEYIDRLLSNFSMNVTALNNYLECPLRFYYNSLVKVPSAKSESAAFGTATHGALADFINHMMNNGKLYPEKNFLIDRFTYHLHSEREVFTQESFARFMELGQQVMMKYHDKYYIPTPKNDFILTEFPLTKIVLNGIPLKGFTDKIQFWGKDIVITDFKTGAFEKAKRRGEFLRPGEKDTTHHGGNYWRQAVFYKILVDNLPGKNWKVLHTQFDFIEPDKNDEFYIERIDISAEEIQHVIKQITDTWEKIQQHDFYTGCGKPDCEWCNFAKDNRLYLKLEEVEPVEL